MDKEGDKDVSFFDIFKPGTEKMDPELAYQRYMICMNCPFFLKGSKRCKKCGCFMQLKTTLRQAKCPMGHW